MRAALFLAAGLAALLGVPGCAWTIKPPAAPPDPVTVWVTEYGRHSRVALPSGRATFLEYGFGEWNFYAREQRGLFSTLRAGAGLGAAAFSRRELSPAEDGTLGPGQTGGMRAVSLQVARSAAEGLRERLEARWAANQPQVIVRSADGVPVSRDRGRYHLFANSNHATAGWLRDLGCRVTGFPVLSNFRLAAPAPGP
jgi:hypothetical protein